MRLFAVLVLSALAGARPPPRPDSAGGDADEAAEGRKRVDEMLEGLPYQRYMNEVVSALEEDPDFRKKLETADKESIQNGDVADQLDFAHRNLRTKLDEIKAREIHRLQKLSQRSQRGENRFKDPNHIDVANLIRFQPQDLKKLILAANSDLDDIDKAKDREFKRYEMEKRFEKEERLKHIEDKKAREAEEERLKNMERKHKDHNKLKHPMTKDQLEDVWEEEDRMKAQDFDPKTFFKMHDLNSDGFLDEEELNALFVREINRAYDPNNPEDDMKERDREFDNMRHHVFKEVDKDKDRRISFDEFLKETKEPEFEKDTDWDTVDERGGVFNEEEYKKFMEQREREIQESIDKGVVPPGYPYYMDGGIPPGAAPYHPVPNHPNDPMAAAVPRSVPGQPAYQPNMQPHLQPPQAQAQASNFQPQAQAPNFQPPLPQAQAPNFQQQAQAPNAPPLGQVVPNVQPQAQVPQNQAPPSDGQPLRHP